MNRVAIAIKNRLSLRPQQADSLNILAELTDKLTLQKMAIWPLRLRKLKAPMLLALILKETSLLSVSLWLRVSERHV